MHPSAHSIQTASIPAELAPLVSNETSTQVKKKWSQPLKNSSSTTIPPAASTGSDPAAKKPATKKGHKKADPSAITAESYNNGSNPPFPDND